MKNTLKGFQLMTINEMNSENEISDLIEEYYKTKEKPLDFFEEDEDYFLIEELKPPHY